jgi:hypothetical protein
MFAFNLAFWGSEGMPPDRYWPSNTRYTMSFWLSTSSTPAWFTCASVNADMVVSQHCGCCTYPLHASLVVNVLCRLKMGIKPGRYGNMDGTKRIYFDNLATLEGL